MIQKPPVIAALTGSIGSGKSTAATIFAQLGAHILDADLLARQAVEKGTPALQKISEIYGKEVILADGTLDRKKLGKMIFSDKELRIKLEGIIHPQVRLLFLKNLEAFKAAPSSPLFMYVVPLLFESANPHPEIEKIVTVSAPESDCVQRIVARDGTSEELARQKLASQLSSQEKEKRSDFIIRNDSTKEHLEAQVKQIYASLTV